MKLSKYMKFFANNKLTMMVKFSIIKYINKNKVNL